MSAWYAMTWITLLVFISLRPATATATSHNNLRANIEAKWWPSFLKPRATKPPNIIWILTDDQDQVLGGSFPPTAKGGATPMPKTKQLMYDQGLHATRWYTHTPICSPARAQLLTGRYFHNMRRKNMSLWSMHVDEDFVNQNTFARVLQQEAGYTVGMFGKYLNVMPKEAPPGFDAWFANGGSAYVGPSFQTKNIDGFADGHVYFSSDPANYSTSVIGNTSIAWIRKMAKAEKPFLAYIAPKAPHEPFNPAVWYRDYWDPTWPEHEQHSPNWNIDSESLVDGHGRPPARKPSPAAKAVMTNIFKNRWRCLMSVDDLVSDVIREVEDLGISDTTYVFFSTDNGFHLGQFNNLMDKRHVYEWDTRIHLLARGPGIRPGSEMPMPGTHVDIAPTLLGLAGLDTPTSMDGRSIVPFLLDMSDQRIPWTARRHVRSLGDRKMYLKNWRTEVFFEYYFVDENVKCVQGCKAGIYPEHDSPCGNLTDNSLCWCKPDQGVFDCYVTETPENNFIAVRDFESGTLYAEFQTGSEVDEDINFDRASMVEHYNLNDDPWSMRNLVKETHVVELLARHDKLRRWFTCAGSSCP